MMDGAEGMVAAIHDPHSALTLRSTPHRELVFCHGCQPKTLIRRFLYIC